jgi:hypothetical protein
LSNLADAAVQKIEDVGNAISDGFNSFVGFFTGNSNSISATETLSSSMSDVPNSMTKKVVNKITKPLGTAAGIGSIISEVNNIDPNDPNSVQSAQEQITKDAFGLIPVAGSAVSTTLESSMSPDGVLNTNNGNMTEGLSSSNQQASSVVNGFIKRRNQEAFSRDTMMQNAQQRRANSQSCTLCPKVVDGKIVNP